MPTSRPRAWSAPPSKQAQYSANCWCECSIIWLTKAELQACVTRRCFRASCYPPTAAKRREVIRLGLDKREVLHPTDD